MANTGYNESAESAHNSYLSSLQIPATSDIINTKAAKYANNSANLWLYGEQTKRLLGDIT